MIARPLARTAAAVVVLCAVAASLPPLVAGVRLAASMLRMPYEARRERLMGDWYRSIERLRREIPRHERIALIAGDGHVVFANSYLYPRRTRMYPSRDAYRSAAFDPARPATIVYVNDSIAERVDYETLRDRDLRAGRRVVAHPQLGPPATSWTLPIAASIEGPPPETFVTEATLVNDGDAPADVRFTLWPSGRTASATIAPRATSSWYDLVHQLYGKTGSGWMSVEASRPLRMAFYFANRGRHDATLLPDVKGPATALPDARLWRDNKLFLVNVADAPATATVNGQPVALPPRGFVVRPIDAIPRVAGNVYAFVTTRELVPRTDFVWPR